MSHEYRNTLSSLAFSLVFNIYLLIMTGRIIAAGHWGSEAMPQLWAKAFLWGLGVGLPIILAAWGIMRLGHKAEDGPFGMKDERDQTLTLHGLAFIAVGTILGLLTSIILMASGGAVFAAFLCLYYGLNLGDLFGNAYKALRYAKGV